MSKGRFRIWRGNSDGGEFEHFAVDLSPGMVVLDAIHKIQSRQANDLAVRWNCKAGKCGSCSMEINGKPRLSCMTRMNEFKEGEEITVQPLKTFPIIKDLVTDVSWNFQQNQRIKPFASPVNENKNELKFFQRDVERSQEFRKCIECFLCQDVCHILRDQKRQDAFVGPRFMIRLAGLEMHPSDTADRMKAVVKEFGSGFCNITRCCTEVCPEHIQITDNAIIPLKERVVSRFYDPLAWLVGKIFGSAKSI